jgi:hypothetical protein
VREERLLIVFSPERPQVCTDGVERPSGTNTTGFI